METDDCGYSILEKKKSLTNEEKPMWHNARTQSINDVTTNRD